MGGRQQSAKLNCVVATALTLLLVTHSIGLSDAKRTYGSSNRKTSGGSSSRTPSSNTHVTKPTYSNTGTNSHADAAKLSYPNYNAQPNRPATGGAAAGGTGGNPAPIGWNVPKQQGPPPAYSASNPAGGAHTNMHEAAPAYRPNNAAPPSYGASGTNVHQPITATNTQGLQSSYPGQQSHYPSAGQVPAGATYHTAGSIPAGATYYPSAGHAPGGYAPGGYAPGGYGGYGHMPAGGGYPSGGVPAGATYIPAGASLPAGATYYAHPPQQSSGLGFGSGLAAGAIGGALLGHALTPTQTRVVEAAPSNNGGGGSGSDDKIIIINNGPPGSVTTSGAGAGTTVINTGAAGAEAAPGAAAVAPAVGAGSVVDPNTPLAPMAPMMNTTDDSVVAPPVPMATMMNTTDGGVAPPQPEQPAPGGIICVPVRLNETDPADSTKMIEVEKIACYPAPPPPPPGAPALDANGQPMAPVNPAPAPDQASQQLQQNPSTGTPLAPMLAEQSSVRASGSNGAKALHSYLELMFSTTMLGILMAFGMQ